MEPTPAACASAGPAQLPRELQQEGPGSPPTHPQHYPVQPASEGGFLKLLYLSFLTHQACSPSQVYQWQMLQASLSYDYKQKE